MATEQISSKKNGWPLLVILLLTSFSTIAGLIYSLYLVANDAVPAIFAFVIIGIIFLLILNVVCLTGLFTLEPNEAAVLILFGKYKGTVRDAGFWWVNPLNKKRKVSLRARNFDSDKLKVNDKKGNPIEVSAVIVWRVEDTAQAAFDVDDYIEYVQVQAESAIRHMASSYPYDETEDEPISLRSSTTEVSESLGQEIQNRVQAAGVIIDEARINHLAYAPEIAQSMLQRQQAEAVIAARQKIVDGAVGMVEMALTRLGDDEIIELDEERKANMVSNLLVVLCADSAAQPVINAGSLY